MKNKKEKWQKFNTRYGENNAEYYTEWEQRGDEIRNHVIYKKINKNYNT